MPVLTTKTQMRHTRESARWTSCYFEPLPPPPPPVGPPTITLVIPASGDDTGGNTVTIEGTGFFNVSAVKFGTVAATSYIVESDTLISAVAPAGTGGDTVDIRVTTDKGTSAVTPADHYAYIALLYWPEEASDWAIAVEANRIWTVQGTVAAYNSTTSPARKISSYVDLSAADTAGTDWSQVGPPGQILLDASYAYFISNQCTVITRVPLTGTMADRQTLVIPQGFWPNECSATGAGIGTGAGGLWQSVIRGGKLYMAFCGKWAGAVSQMKMVVIDLVAWSPTAFNVYDYSTDLALLPGAWGFCITDNGTIVIGCWIAGDIPIGRIYYSNVSTPGTWNFINLTKQPGFACSSGNYAYFLETNHSNAGVSGRTKNLIVVNCTSGTPTVSYVDMSADDSNFLCISQSTQNYTSFPWVSDTHLFVNANYSRNLTGANAHAAENPYFAKRNLVTGASAGGAFYRGLLPWTWELLVDTNIYANGKHWLSMYGLFTNNSLVSLDEAMTAMTIWPNPTSPVPPANDNLANALTLTLGGAALTNQNCYYATYETNEDYGPHGASPTGWDASYQSVYKPEHGIWYKYVAAVTGGVKITLTGNASTRMSLSVWTGTTHPLTNVPVVGGTPPGLNLGYPVNGIVSFAATAGTTYYIRADFMPFNWWEPEVDTTHVFSIALTVANDPYLANVKLLMGFNGANGSTGAPGMTDESPAARGTATVYGSAAISTAQSKFGGSSVHFSSASSDRITFPDSPDFNFGSGLFTVEAWVYVTAAPNLNFIVGQWYSSGNCGWILYSDSTNVLRFNVSTDGTNNFNDLFGGTVSLNTWHHVAVDFDGTKYRLYLDGTMVGSSTTLRTIFDSPNSLSIGSNSGGVTYFFDGYVEELRITKNTARYASDSGLTVPTLPFPRS